MNCFINIISLTSQDKLRKLLKQTLSIAFDEIISKAEDLCTVLWSDYIDIERSQKLFSEIQMDLSAIVDPLNDYVQFRKEIATIDDDNDIDFIDDFLIQFKQLIDSLGASILDGIEHNYRFHHSSDKTQKHRIIHLLKEFQSSCLSFEQCYNDISQIYSELEEVVYNYQDDETVLNQFNGQFKNYVNYLSSLAVEKTLDNVKCSSFHLDLLAAMTATTSTSRSSSNYKEIIVSTMDSFLDGDFYSLYDNPLLLAKEIKRRKVKTEELNDIFARLHCWQLLNRLENHSPPARGRPTIENFYCDFLDLQKLGETIDEIHRSTYHRSLREGLKKDNKQVCHFLLAVLLAIYKGHWDDIFGKIAAYVRFLTNICGLRCIQTLRSFQLKVQQFLRFSKDLHKGVENPFNDEDIVRRWNKKLIKFNSLNRLIDTISGTLLFKVKLGNI